MRSMMSAAAESDDAHDVVDDVELEDGDQTQIFLPSVVR